VHWVEAVGLFAALLNFAILPWIMKAMSALEFPTRLRWIIVWFGLIMPYGVYLQLAQHVVSGLYTAFISIFGSYHYRSVHLIA
jgi:hypothetical protein